MEKFLLDVEFRYHRVPESEYSSDCVNKVITIGIYDTLDEAIEKGNATIQRITKKFHFRERFGRNNGIFGSSNLLVASISNYPECFVHIKPLDCNVDNLEEEMKKAFQSEAEYKKWRSE